MYISEGIDGLGRGPSIVQVGNVFFPKCPELIWPLLQDFLCIMYQGEDWGEQNRWRVSTSLAAVALTFSAIPGPFQLSGGQGHGQ